MLLVVFSSVLLLISGGTASAATSWQNVTPAQVDGGQPYIQQMVAPAKNDAYAIGDVNESHMVLEHWNGTSWSPVTLPMPTGADISYGYSVAASGPKNVWVAGYAHPYGSSTDTAVLDRRNGTTWQAAPVPSGTTVVINVATGGPDDTTIIGNNGVWHWDGLTWSSSDGTLGTAGGLTELPDGDIWQGSNCFGSNCPTQAMTCDGTTEAVTGSYSDVWAVGYQMSGAALTCHWDGSTWTNVSPPPPTTGSQQFRSAVETADGRLWAVGFSHPRRVLHPLLMRYTPGQGWSRLATGDPLTYDNDLVSIIHLPGTTRGLMTADDYGTILYHP